MRRQSESPIHLLALGCIGLVFLPFAIYLLHGIFIVSESYLNQAKWQRNGSKNYSISAQLIAMPSLYGDLHVVNGELVQVDSTQSLDIKMYNVLTVDGMFEKIRSYAFMPFAWETVQYDAEYGYPLQIDFNLFALEGEAEIQVKTLQLE